MTNKEDTMELENKQDYNILHDDEIDLKALWMVLWTNKLALLKIVAGFFVLGIVYLIFSTTLYTSNATMLQTEGNESSSLNSMLSIASSVGMDIGSTAPPPTIDMMQYVSSRKLRTELLEQTWQTKKHEDINLIAYWEISDSTGVLNSIKNGIRSVLGIESKTEEEMRLKHFEAGRQVLAERIKAKYTDGGLILIEAYMEDPMLAKMMVTYIIDATVDYTTQLKADRWGSNREFLVQRLQEIKIELEVTEDGLTAFQMDNQRVADSPELLIELANLKRAVEMKTQLYITLQNEYEFTRIEEAKDLSGLIVLDEAFYPVEPAQPKRIIVLIASIFLGSIFSVPGYLVYRGIKR